MVNKIILTVDISKISGLGLFSKSFIQKDTIIFCAFTITDGKWGDEQEPSNYVNHSLKNNISFLKSEDGNVYVYAFHDIAAGSELAANYNELKQLGCPLDVLVFEGNKAAYQESYNKNRAIRSEMYNRPVGYQYSFAPVQILN